MLDWNALFSVFRSAFQGYHSDAVTNFDPNDVGTRRFFVAFMNVGFTTQHENAHFADAAL
jgi:hypothetical protein